MSFNGLYNFIIIFVVIVSYNATTIRNQQ